MYPNIKLVPLSVQIFFETPLRETYFASSSAIFGDFAVHIGITSGYLVARSLITRMNMFSALDFGSRPAMSNEVLSNGLLKMKPIALFIAVAAVVTRADIFLDSSINNHPDPSWHVLALVNTITTDVFATTLCYSVIPTAIFAVIQAFKPTTFVLTVEKSTIKEPGNCRRKRWAFENAVDGRLSGPNEILKAAADSSPR
ncbi:hypothetical protein QYM36_014160 [Artemia franciscana]|uniref:Uncharacterized protein n=1 Tax=Artemia franciscana TaxID=6661 RepID=A0AA88HJ20_ARTSF|nr:hypothetical protein QYM36_014160 [Artemia franciscana]